MDSSEALHSNNGSNNHDNTTTANHYQNVVVMRHGDRLDNFDPLWVSKAARPWDPPLVDEGKKRAFATGQKLRTHLGFPIHRVFVSPFIRCVQTASEVVSGLSAPLDDDSNGVSCREDTIGPSNIKVSIEYGLCEMLNREAIRAESAPKDGEFGFKISELEPILPSGSVDHSVEPVYKEPPKWGETVIGARTRYAKIVQTLADKYPTENLLLVTHGEGVGVSVSAHKEGVTVYEVQYCAFAELRRPIIINKDQSSTPGNFEVLTQNGQTGISFCPSDSSAVAVNQ
ncbi:hypothetical protein FEM48_Zijuj08G0003900 [Ziziphus jujuba var. spinosa]|uniref:Uncharacterized protein n=1 Tax=Ziziphus jujuba var. spinosa TaxID=714518 RepID=A0A978UVX1_ZIZJJ|nr:hypothetical protein FEM48_Zijuj08G0003900 [Ziziphus jujuba var. spinosa]